MPRPAIRRSLIAVAVATALPPGAALAQLEEIIVTAQKRAESAQDVPIAVTAFDASALKSQQIATFGDMLRVPGGRGSLLEAKARGADVRMVYSPLDALDTWGRHAEDWADDVSGLPHLLRLVEVGFGTVAVNTPSGPSEPCATTPLPSLNRSGSRPV